MEMRETARAALRIVMLISLYFAMQLLFVSVATTLCVLVSSRLGEIPAEALARMNEARYLAANPGVNDCIVDGAAIGMFVSSAVMLLFLHFSGNYRLRFRSFRLISRAPLLLATMLIFAAMFALNIFVQWFPLQDKMAWMFEGLSHNILGIIGMVLLAPLLEEVLFRGAIQGLLMRLFGKPWPAIIVAALIFGIVHWNPVQVVYATLLGIVLGWIYYRSGNLVYVIVGHVLNNAVAAYTTATLSSSVEEEFATTGYSIVAFLLFAAIAVQLAMRLHHKLPAPQNPWCESCDVPTKE